MRSGAERLSQARRPQLSRPRGRLGPKRKLPELSMFNARVQRVTITILLYGWHRGEDLVMCTFWWWWWWLEKSRGPSCLDIISVRILVQVLRCMFYHLHRGCCAWTSVSIDEVHMLGLRSWLCVIRMVRICYSRGTVLTTIFFPPPFRFHARIYMFILQHQLKSETGLFLSHTFFL